jgi:hypothetical protein
MTHLLEDVPEMLTVTIDEYATVVAHVLLVPAAEVSIEECVRHAPQCLHGCLKAIASDIELDATLLRFPVRSHNRDLAPKISAPRVDLRKSFGALGSNLGEPLGVLLDDICVCTLEARPGSTHKLRNTGAEGGPQVRIQVVQHGIKHYARFSTS